MTSNPPSLRNICFNKIIGEYNGEEIEKFDLPYTLLVEFRKRISENNNYYANLGLLNRAERYFLHAWGKQEEEMYEKERKEILKITDHLNFGYEIEKDLMSNYLITDGNYEFIRRFNKRLPKYGVINTKRYKNVKYQVSPAKYGILKLDRNKKICKDCNKMKMNFHAACEICEGNPPYEVCNCPNNEDLPKYDFINKYYKYWDFISFKQVYNEEEENEYIQNTFGVDRNNEYFEEIMMAYYGMEEEDREY